MLLAQELLLLGLDLERGTVVNAARRRAEAWGSAGVAVVVATTAST